MITLLQCWDVLSRLRPVQCAEGAQVRVQAELDPHRVVRPREGNAGLVLAAMRDLDRLRARAHDARRPGEGGIRAALLC